jgi:hypothetical protein
MLFSDDEGRWPYYYILVALQLYFGGPTAVVLWPDNYVLVALVSIGVTHIR